MNTSPYLDLPISSWKNKTLELINEYPIPPSVLVNAVLESWNLIYGSVIGGKITIGKDYFPTPQILGDFLHELIPLELSKFNNVFRKGILANEKDIVCEYDECFSMEIKTSSQKGIYGNRSFAQKDILSRKDKSGYYLAINFPPVHKYNTWKHISQIRFGWLDFSDWQGQKSQSGQQANLCKDVLDNKFVTIFQDH